MASLTCSDGTNTAEQPRRPLLVMNLQYSIGIVWYSVGIV